MSAELVQDQEDIQGRLNGDPFFAGITVLLQRKGNIDAQVEQNLSVLNEKGGKIGLVAIVLMPTLTATAPDAPSPLYDVKATIQVIESPTFNLGDGGTGISAEQVAQYCRQILHHFSDGRGNVWVFQGMDPLPVEEGKISYGVNITRRGGDSKIAKVAKPVIAPTSGATPQAITLTCATAAAAIWYTIDGSYPSAEGETAALYEAPFQLAAAATVRAAAQKVGLQQSDVVEATFN